MLIGLKHEKNNTVFLKEFCTQVALFRHTDRARKLGRGHKQSRGKWREPEFLGTQSVETFTTKAMDYEKGERGKGGRPLRDCLHQVPVLTGIDCR